MRQTIEGSFSAVSKSNVARKKEQKELLQYFGQNELFLSVELCSITKRWARKDEKNEQIGYETFKCRIETLVKTLPVCKDTD